MLWLLMILYGGAYSPNQGGAPTDPVPVLTTPTIRRVRKRRPT